MTSSIRIFISYARKDGRELARRRKEKAHHPHYGLALRPPSHPTNPELS